MVKVDRLPSGNYRARVHLGGGKYKPFTGKDKKEVQFRAAQFEATHKTEEAAPESSMTLGEAMEKSVESKKNVLSPATYREYTQVRLNNFESIRNIPLCELTQEQIQAEVNLLSANNSPKTVHNKYGVLLSAVKMFRPEFTPRIVLPKKKKSDIIIPTEEEMIALFREVRGTDIELPVLLGSISGMRFSEIIGLRWSAVDLKKRTIRIKAAKVRDINKQFVEKGTKSRAGTRTIRILPYVYDALKRHYDPSAEFLTTATYAQIYDRYQKALERCCPGKHYTFHELRHYAASVMIMLGIPVKYIADYLGHETEDMVNRVYGHIMLDKKDMMFDKVEMYYNDVFEKMTF